MAGSHRRSSWVDGRTRADLPATRVRRLRVGRRAGVAAVAAGCLVTGLVVAVAANAAPTPTRTAAPTGFGSSQTSTSASTTAPPTPAHLAATLKSGVRSLAVTWRLDVGGERVTAVRITRRVGASGEPVVLDRPARSGTMTLTGLAAGRTYTVTVAPVIDGSAATPVKLTGTTKGVGSSAPTKSTGQGRATTGSGAAAPVRSSPSGDPSGAGIPATPAGWKVLYSQDFTRAAALGRFASTYPGWASYDGTTDTSRETARPKAKVGIWNSATTTSVHDGVFDCHLWTKGVQPQVCALTPTPNGQPGQLYGRYSVRFKVDALPGYKIAWLLWPGSNIWSQGEIDFPEGSLDGTVTGNVHRVDGDPSDSAYYVDTKARMTSWQTATIDWRPGRITFLLGDQSWTTTDPRGLPKNPMRWALQAETEIRAAAPDPDVQGHVLIDWLVGYRYTG